MKKLSYLLMLILLALPLCACAPNNAEPTKVELTQENYQEYIEFNTSFENFSYYEYDSKTYVVGVYKLYAVPQYNYTFDHVVITYSVYDTAHNYDIEDNPFEWMTIAETHKLYLDYSGHATSSYELYKEKLSLDKVQISPVAVEVVVEKIEGYVVID